MTVGALPPLVVVGNPDNRRVALFRAAAADWPAPIGVLPWRQLAAGPVRLPAGALVRVDSPGEDAEVDRLLRGADRPAEHGEIGGAAAWYRGFRTALDRLAEAVSVADATLLNDPGETAVMFDKQACHTRLAVAGVPQPAALPALPADWSGLRAALREHGWARVFVKPVHGSSASGVLALRFAPGRVAATTSVELAPDGRLFNSLRVRTYTDERQVAAIVDRLAPDGLHVQRWIPKAGLADRVVDLRVLVVAGEPTHVVVRSSRGPLTNLHLGNARGDLAEVRAALGPDGFDAVLDTCARAAQVFPGSLHAGVDLLLGTDWRRHMVAEMNAFGDLLPGLLDRAGRDSYAAQLHALRRGWRGRRTTGADVTSPAGARTADPAGPQMTSTDPVPQSAVGTGSAA